MQKRKCRWCKGIHSMKNIMIQSGEYPYLKNKLFSNFLTLETFQAGLSWITVLRKREISEKLLINLTIQKIASIMPQKEKELLNNRGIITKSIKNKCHYSKCERLY